MTKLLLLAEDERTVRGTPCSSAFRFPAQVRSAQRSTWPSGPGSTGIEHAAVHGNHYGRSAGCRTRRVGTRRNFPLDLVDTRTSSCGLAATDPSLGKSLVRMERPID
jgi:hypothetical protein